MQKWRVLESSHVCPKQKREKSRRRFVTPTNQPTSAAISTQRDLTPDTWTWGQEKCSLISFVGVLSSFQGFSGFLRFPSRHLKSVWDVLWQEQGADFLAGNGTWETWCARVGLTLPSCWNRSRHPSHLPRIKFRRLEKNSKKTLLRLHYGFAWSWSRRRLSIVRHCPAKLWICMDILVQPVTVPFV